MRVAQLRHDPDVSGMQLADFGPLLAHGHAQMVQFLRHLARRVPDLLAVLHGPGVRAEVRHVPHVRLRDGLEDLRHEGLGVVDLQGDALGAAPLRPLDRRSLVRRGHQLDELGEQRPRPVGELRRAAEQREQLAPQHPRFHRGDRLVPPDLLAAEVALEQGVVGLGDALDQLLRVLLEAGPVLAGDVHLLVLARLRALLVQMTLLREQIDDAVELRPLAHRDLHGNDLRRQQLLDLAVHLLEVGVLLVHQGHEEHPRDAALLAVVPHLLRPNLDSARRRHHDQGAVRRPDAGERLAREIEIPGGVDEVDLRVHPLGDAEGEVDGILAFDLVGGVVGEGGPLLDGPVALARAGHEREGVNQGGLAARAVAHHGHVADLRCLVHAHGR